MTADIVIFAQQQSGKLTTASMATKQTSPPPQKKKKIRKQFLGSFKTIVGRPSPLLQSSLIKTSRKLRLIEPLAAQYPDFMEMGRISIINLRFRLV